MYAFYWIDQNNVWTSKYIWLSKLGQLSKNHIDIWEGQTLFAFFTVLHPNILNMLTPWGPNIPHFSWQ